MSTGVGLEGRTSLRLADDSAAVLYKTGPASLSIGGERTCRWEDLFNTDTDQSEVNEQREAQQLSFPEPPPHRGS
jgi:hypothetical protein